MTRELKMTQFGKDWWQMIQIIPAYTRSGNEWCTCCSKTENTKRIKFSQDGNGGTSIVLCDDCRKELIMILSESEK